MRVVNTLVSYLPLHNYFRNLQDALISTINCRILAPKKTGSKYSVQCIISDIILFTCVSSGWVQSTIRGLLLKAYSNKGETLTTLYLGKGELKQPLRRRKKDHLSPVVSLSAVFGMLRNVPLNVACIPKNGCEADYRPIDIGEKLSWVAGTLAYPSYPG